jgi:hypothetical protein
VTFSNSSILSNYVEPLPPPNDVRLTDITSEGLVFSWSSVSSNCSAISYYYNISSDNCGDCPVNTTSTTITCRELQLTSNVQMCQLSVQTIVCDRIGSVHSNPLITMLPTGTLVSSKWKSSIK